MKHNEGTMTHEEFKEEINSRQYSKAMRIAYQEAGQTPYEFILTQMRDYHLNGDPSTTVTHLANDEITQDKLISEIERLGYDLYPQLTNPRHVELINTIGPQWRHRTMTTDARRFALQVLGVLENMARNSQR